MRHDNNVFDFDELKLAKETAAEIKNLEKDQQYAILWLMYHVGFLDIIDSGRIMTDVEAKKWMEQAVEDNDHILMSLIMYKLSRDEKRTEKQKIPLDRGGELAYNSDSQSENRE